MAKGLNRDFHVKEVGAGVFTITVECYTRDGAQQLIDFLMAQDHPRYIVQERLDGRTQD